MKLSYSVLYVTPALLSLSCCAKYTTQPPPPITMMVAQNLHPNKTGDDLMTVPIGNLKEGEEVMIYLTLHDAAPDIENCNQSDGSRCGHFIHDNNDWRSNDGWWCTDCSISILDGSGQVVQSFKFRDDSNLEPPHPRDFLDSIDPARLFEYKVLQAGPYAVRVRYHTNVRCAGGGFECTTKVGDIKVEVRH